MKLGEAFPSKWLTVTDVPEDGLQVKIESYEITEVGQGQKKESKPVLYFLRQEKGLILNKTNGATIAEVMGSDEMDDWIGKAITLVPREVEFQGDTVWAIRVQKPKPQRGTPKPPAITQDDVPF